MREAATQATKLLTLTQLQSHGCSRGKGQAGAPLPPCFERKRWGVPSVQSQRHVPMSWEEYATGWLKHLLFHLCHACLVFGVGWDWALSYGHRHMCFGAKPKVTNNFSATRTPCQGQQPAAGLCWGRWEGKGRGFRQRVWTVLYLFSQSHRCCNSYFKEMVLEGKSLVIHWCSGESCTLPQDQTFQNIFVEILYLLLTDTDGGKWFFLQTKVRKLHLIVMSLKEKISVLYCSEGCASVLVSISQC